MSTDVPHCVPQWVKEAEYYTRLMKEIERMEGSDWSVVIDNVAPTFTLTKDGTTVSCTLTLLGEHVWPFAAPTVRINGETVSVPPNAFRPHDTMTTFVERCVETFVERCVETE